MRLSRTAIRKIKQHIKLVLLIIKQYSFIPAKSKSNPAIIIMFDDTMRHGGLLDRIKGIITAKLIAEKLQYGFGIYADERSFNLFKFLKLHQPAIQVKKADLVYNIWHSKPVLFYNIFGPAKAAILKQFKNQKRQYHFYCNLNLISSFFPQLSQNLLEERWRIYFNQLFYFDSYFSNCHTTLFGGTSLYGIHLRFQSLLGDGSKEGVCLPVNQKKELIANCVKSVRKIMELNHHQLFLIVSDSTVFIKYIKQSRDVDQQRLVVSEGDSDIAHVDFGYSEDVLKKAILDFYLLSRCTSIYQVLTREMYNSQFCKYAAILGNAKYILLNANHKQ